MAEDGLEPSDYIEDGSINWTGREGLAAGVVGTILSVVGYAIASYIGMIQTGVNTIVSGYGSWYAKLLSTPFATAAGEARSAVETATTAISSWGVIAFPIAVIVTVASVSLMLWGVTRFVR